MKQIFASSLENKVSMDLKELNRRVDNGENREKAETTFLGEENFNQWYESLMKEMAGRADG